MGKAKAPIKRKTAKATKRTSRKKKASGKKKRK